MVIWQGSVDFAWNDPEVIKGHGILNDNFLHLSISESTQGWTVPLNLIFIHLLWKN